MLCVCSHILDIQTWVEHAIKTGYASKLNEIHTITMCHCKKSVEINFFFLICLQDEIIPEDFRNKVAEEEHQKEMADLYLPPRKRTTVSQGGQQVC